MYQVRLETFSGSVKVIKLPSRGAVAKFISEYPNTIPSGVSVKINCDALSVAGVLRGRA